MTDTLDLFLASVDVAKVEAERFPALAVVKRESFGGADHRAMLDVHMAETAKLALARVLLSERKGETARELLQLARVQSQRKLRHEQLRRERAVLAVPSIADSLAAHRAQLATAATHTAA